MDAAPIGWTSAGTQAGETDLFPPTLLFYYFVVVSVIRNTGRDPACISAAKEPGYGIKVVATYRPGGLYTLL